MGRLDDLLFEGLFALFLACLAIYAVNTLGGIAEIVYASQHMFLDSYDTALSIRYVHDYGPLGTIPAFGFPLFGHFPLLYAVLGAALDSVLHDDSLSMSALYWLIELCIAYLVSGEFLKGRDMREKLIFTSFFLLNLSILNLFPFGMRRRQQLAVLLGLAMLLSKSRYARSILAFLSMLAQPFAGAALIVLQLLRDAEKREYAGMALLAASVLLAYPFYSGLGSALGEAPALPGCTFVFQNPDLLLSSLIGLTVIAFYAGNAKRMGAADYASLAMALTVPASIAILAVAKMAGFGLFVSLSYLLSASCHVNLLNASIVGVLAAVSFSGIRPGRVALVLMMAMVTYSSTILALETAKSNDALYRAIMDGYGAAGISRIKSFDFAVVSDGSDIRFMPMFPDLATHGYALFEGYNITYVDEVIPPELSRGESNALASGIPQAIYDGDAEACSSAVRRLKSENVQALQYFFFRTVFLEVGAEARQLRNDTMLASCGLERLPVLGPSYGDALFYKIT